MLHYVNVCKSSAMIGQYGCNAGFQGKYQEAYWFLHWVTRTPQKPRASPHKLCLLEYPHFCLLGKAYSRHLQR